MLLELIFRFVLNGIGGRTVFLCWHLLAEGKPCTRAHDPEAHKTSSIKSAACVGACPGFAQGCCAKCLGSTMQSKTS
eukprot:2539203-Amphidinium_carterae.1